MSFCFCTPFLFLSSQSARRDALRRGVDRQSRQLSWISVASLHHFILVLQTLGRRCVVLFGISPHAALLPRSNPIFLFLAVFSQGPRRFLMPDSALGEHRTCSPFRRINPTEKPSPRQTSASMSWNPEELVGLLSYAHTRVEFRKGVLKSLLSGAANRVLTRFLPRTERFSNKKTHPLFRHGLPRSNGQTNSLPRNIDTCLG